jgi:hypothetical protein
MHHGDIQLILHIRRIRLCYIFEQGKGLAIAFGASFYVAEIRFRGVTLHHSKPLVALCQFALEIGISGSVLGDAVEIFQRTVQ